MNDEMTYEMTYEMKNEKYPGGDARGAATR